MNSSYNKWIDSIVIFGAAVCGDAEFYYVFLFLLFCPSVAKSQEHLCAHEKGQTQQTLIFSI